VSLREEHNGYPDNPDACGACELGEFLASDGRCSHCKRTEADANADIADRLREALTDIAGVARRVMVDRAARSPAAFVTYAADVAEAALEGRRWQ
jgi:hypothetical protein